MFACPASMGRPAGRTAHSRIQKALLAVANGVQLWIGSGQTAEPIRVTSYPTTGWTSAVMVDVDGRRALLANGAAATRLGQARMVHAHLVFEPLRQARSARCQSEEGPGQSPTPPRLLNQLPTKATYASCRSCSQLPPAPTAGVDSNTNPVAALDHRPATPVPDTPTVNVSTLVAYSGT